MPQCACAGAAAEVRERVHLALYADSLHTQARCAAGELQEPSKRAAEAIVKQQDALIEEMTHGHPF